MKKILMFVLVMFLVVGCFNNEEDPTDQPINEVDTPIVDDREAPVFDDFELRETISQGNFTIHYYVGDFEVAEAREIFVDWALQNGWQETEDSLQTTRIFEHSQYERMMTMTAYLLHEGEHEGLVEVMLSMPND